MQTAPRLPEVLLKIALALVIAILLSLFAHRASASPLVVYTYDSIAAKEGLGPILKAAYKKKTGEEITFVTVGDAGQLLSRIQLDLERNSPKAHIVLGIDQNLFLRLKESLAPLDRSREGGFMKFVDREWWLGDAFVPFDFGVFAFVADTKKLKPSDFPKKWKDLLKWRFKKSLLLEDPRTSSPGLAFVLATQAAVASKDEEESREDFKEFWKDLKSQWITLAPGWSQAYGMFLKGEAPLVWSYVSSEAYHRSECEKTKCAEPDRYRAVIFSDGNPVQIEGAAMLKDAPGGVAMRKRSLEFLELLTSEEIQKAIPETQWMMPVRLGVKLPTAFQVLPVAKKRFPPESDRERVDGIMERWNQAVR